MDNQGSSFEELFPIQGSYRLDKTKFPDISLTPIQISLTKPYSPEKLSFSLQIFFQFLVFIHAFQQVYSK